MCPVLCVWRTLFTVLCRCFSASEIPWYLRQVVSAIFATTPSSTYEEALKHFQKAEECGLEFFVVVRIYINKGIGYHRPGQTLWCTLSVTSCVMAHIWLWCVIGHKVWAVSTQRLPLGQTLCVSRSSYSFIPVFSGSRVLQYQLAVPGQDPPKARGEGKGKRMAAEDSGFWWVFCWRWGGYAGECGMYNKEVHICELGHATQAKF